MAISSINIQPATAHCFAHNDRSDKVTYLIDSSKENECSAPAPVAQKALAQMISEAEKYRKENGLRAMKSDTVKAVEAVVNLNATHKLADVERLAEKIEAEFGFRAVQIAVHRDEGKSSSEKNYHAHIVMCNLTPEGTTIQRTLGRDGLKKLQDITARELGMERGKSSNAKHIDHKIYRVVAKEQENLLEKIDELQKENLAQGYTLKEYQARIVGLEGANTELRKELHAQNRDINKTQDLEAKERKITELEAKLTEIEGKNTDLSRNLEMVRSLRTDDKQKISELTEQVIAKDQMIDHLKEAPPEPINASLIVQLQDENKILKITNKALETELQEAKRPSAAVEIPQGDIEQIEEVKKLKQITLAVPNTDERNALAQKLQKENAIDEIAKSCYKRVEEKGVFTTTTKTVFDTKTFVEKIKEREKDHQKLHSFNDRIIVTVVDKMKTIVEMSKTALEAVKSKFMGKSIDGTQKERTELNLSDTDKIRGFVDQLKENEPSKSRGMDLSR